jgi:predicted CXXCH cytochrome family protein
MTAVRAFGRKGPGVLIAAALAAGILGAATAAWPAHGARADAGPHTKGGALAGTDTCAACHRTHSAPAAGLRLQSQPGMCYVCHGIAGTGAQTSVENGTLYATTDRSAAGGALRGGGFASARLDSADPSLPPPGTPNTDLGDAGTDIGVLASGQPATSRHTISGAPGTMWGSGTTGPGSANALVCTSCHDPHGNGRYRILREIPTNSGAATPVNVVDYLRPAVGLDPGAAANLSAWCSQCHTRYLSTTPGDGTYFTQYRHKAVDGSVPGCANCHVSHGTNAIVTAGGPAALVEWPDGASWSADTSSPALPASANSRLLRMDNRGICQKCHNQ